MLREILPKCGLVVSEKGNLSEVSKAKLAAAQPLPKAFELQCLPLVAGMQVLCKPKILPIKSAHVERLEQLAKAAMEGPESKQQEEKE